jgi:hypothetical protein
VQKISIDSSLSCSREIYDFGRCYVLHLPSRNACMENVVHFFQAAIPKWIGRLLEMKGEFPLIMLLKYENEIILGTNLQHLEIRIKIMHSDKNIDEFYFALIINSYTLRGHCHLMVLKILYLSIFKRILINLENSFQSE